MKCILFLIAAVGFFPAVRAQLSYGIKAGLNFSTESVGSNDYSTSAQTGFNGGIFARWLFVPSFAARVEVFYSGEGTREEYKPTGTEGNINRGFLRVPVLVQYNIGAGIYAETGPQVGFLLSSKEKFDGMVTNIKQYYSAVNLGWCFGIGYRLDGLVKGLEVNARYAPGLTRLNKEDIAGKSLSSSVLSTGLFYTMPSRYK